MSETICASCDKECDAKTQNENESMEEYLKRQEVFRNMCQIKQKIFVLSGKGGVGKSTIAVNLALGLAAEGKKTGLLDVDVHGPSVPVMLGLQHKHIEVDEEGKIIPVKYSENLSVMSVGFLLKDITQAVVWRGPMKYGAIKQFLEDVRWDELDYLIIDSPPGTGDEPLAAIQLVEGEKHAVIVTTPQEIALADVRRCFDFCSKLNVPVTGIVENMSGFKCPDCNKVFPIFKSGGGLTLSEEYNTPLLATFPINPEFVFASDLGENIQEKFNDLEYIQKFIEKFHAHTDKKNLQN